MDQFITIVKQKVPDIPGRENICKTINSYLTDKATICIYGGSGVGKTYTISAILKGERVIEVTNDTIKSKEASLSFIEMVKDSFSNILFDDIDMDSIGWREIVTAISNNGRLSRGSTIIVCKNIHKIDFCDCIKMEKLDDKHILDIGKTFYPNASNEKIETSLELCEGNIRNFFYYIEGSDQKDIFITPKEFIHDILTKSDTDASDYIGYSVDDHGYSWGIVHENYISAKGIDDNFHEIAEEMSLADQYDNILYNGNWDLTPYFCIHGIIKPAIMVNKQIYRETLRPGSSWTKFNNHKMRLSRLRDICNRTPYYNITKDTLMLLKDMCIKDIDKAIPTLIEYNIQPQDMDIINHLAILTKIKPRALQNVKKKLKQHYEEVLRCP
jgi:hypothetical protein